MDVSSPSSSLLDDVCAVLSVANPSLIDGDIAAWNLICASGLPGGESIPLDDTLARLDDMAAHIDAEIRRNYHRFLADPAQSENSQAKYCVLMLVTVLQQDFGVRYNPDRIRDPDFRHAGDLFLHGMLGGNGGTCASMPVLYTAIGRRLGWPMKLAAARGHLFCRWDDVDGCHPFGKERFNLEGTCQGAHLVSDEYYREWPEPLSDEMVATGRYLRSLTPEEELAAFLAMRGHCLEDNGRVGQASDAYRLACRLAPLDPHYQAFLVHAEMIRERMIEERTLRDYFGSAGPLPFGYFPRYVLQQLSSNMMLAEFESSERNRRAKLAQREALNPVGHQQVTSIRSGWIPPPTGRRVTLQNPARAVVNPHFAMDQTSNVWNHGFPGPLPLPGLATTFPDTDELTYLPARLLGQVAPQRLSSRRQEAIAICRSLPAGVVITQPRRMLLTPPQSANPHLNPPHS